MEENNTNVLPVRSYNNNVKEEVSIEEDHGAIGDEIVRYDLERYNKEETVRVKAKIKEESTAYQENHLKNEILPVAQAFALAERRVRFIKGLIECAQKAIQYLQNKVPINLPKMFQDNLNASVEIMTLSYEDELKARDHIYDELTSKFHNITKETRPQLLETARKRFESEANEFSITAWPENTAKLQEWIDTWQKEVDDLEKRSVAIHNEKTIKTVEMHNGVYAIDEHANQKAKQIEEENAVLMAINQKDLKLVVEKLEKSKEGKRQINTPRVIGGYTKIPLHFACEVGDLDIVKHLITIGANPRVKGSDDYTALHYAVRRTSNAGKENAVKVIEYLVKEIKLDIEATTNVGSRSRTPFLLACYEGNFEAAKKLRTLGASHTCTESKTGNTALHIACERGHYDIVVWLCKQGLSPLVSNSLKESPVYLAVVHNRIPIAKFFYDAGIWLSKAERERFKKDFKQADHWAITEISFPK